MQEPTISTKPIAENRSSYKSWVASEGIPIIQGFFIEDIRKVALEPWQRTGGLAARLCLEGTGETNDAYVCEIPAGKALKPQRHLFEELIYIVSGRGATTVWNDPASKHTFEWQEGSVFSPPLNSWYQHFNGNGAEPARYLAVTTAPCMINLLHNTDFIFNCGYVFTDRFDSQTDYFQQPRHLVRRKNLADQLRCRRKELKIAGVEGTGRRRLSGSLGAFRKYLVWSHRRVCRRRIQESAFSWAGCARHHLERPRIFSYVAPRPADQALRLEAGEPGCSSRQLVSPAFEFRCRTGALFSFALGQPEIPRDVGRRKRQERCRRQVGRQPDRIRR